jgi:hypothetical protein
MKKYLLFVSSIAALTVIILSGGVFVGLRIAGRLDALAQSPKMDFFDLGGSSLLDNIFDKTYRIKDTSVSFMSPSAGFYNWGLRVYEEPHTIAIHPALEYDLITLWVSADPIPLGTTLRQAVQSGKVGNTSDIDVWGRAGSYVTINGHEYYIYKFNAGERQETWRALSLGQKELISISLDYRPGDTASTFAGYRNNDQLFFQILSHVNFD